MKLISLIKPIKVNYFGIELSVPHWTKFIATDESGLVFACNMLPRTEFNCYERWDSDSPSFRDEIIAVVDLEEMDWEETLVEI
ncbi:MULTISPECIES: hypothetical protein [Photorhabdus]|uniref:hypothetical protein n=1 Tax=Photorhabdus TaxID=29487 RepID=UPI000DCEB036|nr:MULTISPECIES: hypothetical protein [Photorhabdus]MCT8345118.1 hypothetical protein [Photorhabdus kleinii]RAW90999.1 hypothetical protein CKY03_24365 [Photorhabdus sp. S9-53]RAW94872.1 hypothetical protein CKY04_24325 [Photorhabdus sp. S8-52]